MSEVERIRSIVNPYSPAHQAPRISDQDRRQKRHAPEDRLELHREEDPDDGDEAPPVPASPESASGLDLEA